KTPKQEAGGTMPPAVVRGFSGHWMAFYSTALAILYSAARADERNRSRRCPNGHTVGPLAEYCERCGQRVMELPKPAQVSSRPNPAPADRRKARRAADA